MIFPSLHRAVDPSLSAGGPHTCHCPCFPSHCASTRYTGIGHTAVTDWP
ncbi:hypothetical protein ACFFS4_06970 [Kutzneria kofuensis]|nr:hypothetical protein [Kutzneria kofuensis]